MTHGLINMIAEITALIAGGAIGVGFGMVQDAARRRNEKRQAEGKINNIWSLMPGSGTRVAYLLIALVVIQLICPLLFQNGVQWWVSAGLVTGYGWMLFRGLRARRSDGV